MNQGIGDQFTDSNTGEHAGLRAQGCPDMFVLRQQAVDIIDQTLKSRRVTALYIPTPDDAGGPVVAVIGDKTNPLTGQTGVEIIEIFCQQNSAQIGDVPVRPRVLGNYFFGRQTIKNPRPVIGQRLLRKIEVCRIVQQRQHLIRAYKRPGKAGFPGIGLHFRP